VNTINKQQLTVDKGWSSSFGDWTQGHRVDRGVSCGQRGGSPMVVNPSFLDRVRYHRCHKDKHTHFD
jgi:hypothetical protein